ncbi:YeeE/YedE family protein [Thermodesulfobacteriota bacterium]
MDRSEPAVNWKMYTGILLIIIFLVTIAAIYTNLWVITAVPIGLLFGFFLKKGELCGASAISEVILMKDKSKAFGIWVAIIVSMAAFAMLDIMGLVKLNPKPFIYLNYIIGGILFGTGIVLAGGCVSGCLFKAGSGNINSMAGLVGIPLGIALVEYGPLSEFHKYLKSFVLKSQEGGSITLSSLTGIPYWLLACLFIIATIAAVFIRQRKKANQDAVITDNTGAVKKIITRRWSPWKAGLAIGILAMFAYLSSAASGRNYPLGVTHGVLHLQLAVTESSLNPVWKKAEVKTTSMTQQNPVPLNNGKKVSVWLMLLVTSLVIGSWVSARLSGTMQFVSRPPSQTVIAFIGGILLGTGATIATGCVIGNILSGWALMSVGNLLFGLVVILSNWLVTYFYLMGGGVSDLVSNK